MFGVNNYHIKLGVLKVKHKMDAKFENFVTPIPSFAGSLDFLVIHQNGTSKNIVTIEVSRFRCFPRMSFVLINKKKACKYCLNHI